MVDGDIGADILLLHRNGMAGGEECGVAKCESAVSVAWPVR